MFQYCDFHIKIIDYNRIGKIHLYIMKPESDKKEYICYAYDTTTINHFIIPVWESADAAATLHKFSFVGFQKIGRAHV